MISRTTFSPVTSQVHIHSGVTADVTPQFKDGFRIQGNSVMDDDDGWLP